MAPKQPPNSSILNLLNPYASIARSTAPLPDTQSDPDSPSAVLLRELSGDDPPSPPLSRQISARSNHARPSWEKERDRKSPTPTPTVVRRPTHVINSSSSSSSDEEGDAPPRSLIYGEDPTSSSERAGKYSGERTPRSPQGTLPGHQPLVTSPGPFRAEPPSSSASGASEPRSRSTSPGPSTMSIYASGMEGTQSVMNTATSRDASTSTDSSSRHSAAPTFREQPHTTRPGPPSRIVSGRSSQRPRPAQRVSESDTNGYLDPPPIPAPVDRKGKGKAKNQGGRVYHEMPTQEEDEADADDVTAPLRGRLAGFGIGQSGKGILRKAGLNEYEKAMWRWVNVEDLDAFLQEVYDYYKGKGIYCIALAKVLNLLTTFFVITFSTFLMSCIDYSKLNSTISGTSISRLDDVLINQCISGGSLPHKLFIACVTLVYIFQLASFAMSLPKLLEMYRFYTHLLGIPDADIQTLPWPEIVRLIGEIRKHNPVTSLSGGQADAMADLAGEDVSGDHKKLDAHDVANRILRQENYLIALFNKDLLDLRVRFPIPHSMVHWVPVHLLAPPTSTNLPSTQHDRKERRYISFGKNTLTKALEWNLRYCLMGYLFDRRGQVRKEFVKDRKRKGLVEGLKTRFIFMGVMNAILAPFIVIYLLLYSFFRYFDQYHKNPSSIGSRNYTLYAQWKFREFNELPHLFERRLARSHPIASEYIDQFPKERTALVMRFVAFVAGSFAAVLLVASLVDPDLFLHFEITPHRTVFFYLGVFGAILAVARGMIPEDNHVFDPDASLREVVRWTHYLPGEWKGKLHSQMVHTEFGNLFAMKITIFFTELLSVLLTPLILFFSLPPCAGAIIDFFREFTVHVDGVGYVCSFAVFDFRRHGDLKAVGDGEPTTPEDTISPKGGDAPTSPNLGRGKKKGGQAALARDWRSNENKMEKSFLHFKATHPDWQPRDPTSSMFLDRLTGLHQQSLQNHNNAEGRSPGIIGRKNITSPTGIASSVYGGRGMGLGGDESRLKERSRSYDRAWAKSSHLLKSNRQPMAREDTRSDIISEEGDQVIDEEGVAADSWSKKQPVSGDGDDRRDEILKDAGMIGLLQQVMGR